MSTLKLTYFDFNGGRGEPARLAMFIGGIPFEDNRITFDKWPALKVQLPFQVVPQLEVDGKTISQSNTINRYVGKLAGLYPTDPWQAALCDEIMDAVDDISDKITATFFISDEDQKKSAREALAGGPIPLYLTTFQAYLQQRNADYFADGRLTVADLKVFIWTRHLQSGTLDYIPIDIIEKSAPLLVKHLERLTNHDRIQAYYQSH